MVGALVVSVVPIPSLSAPRGFPDARSFASPIFPVHGRLLPRILVPILVVDTELTVSDDSHARLFPSLHFL